MDYQAVYYVNGDLGSISSTFYMQLLHQQSRASKVQTYNLSTKKLRAQLMYGRKTLVKLNPIRVFIMNVRSTD
jgi:hypothetical protein